MAASTGALLWALVAAFGAYAVAEVGLLALALSALSALAIPLALFAWRRLAQSSEEKPDACTIGPHCARSAASRRA
ncbi:hypothetical protein ACTJKJ_18410 [Roseateles sp. 22389]|uniref:hypothetical protein n=1 Tax=Roseateles sp. 22389 TaxID=3453916 RepID=UPI00263301E9|nr:hypothetical protein [uncultured Roseateles sp.]